MEEVGFDIKDRIHEDEYLQTERNGQIIRLYLITNVPLETKFICKTKNENQSIDSNFFHFIIIVICFFVNRLGYALVSHC